MVWRKEVGEGLGGLAASPERLIVSLRGLGDKFDVFKALDPATGEERWQRLYPAPGKLDYGNAPRATPLIHDGRVYLYGAFGHLSCADLDTGALQWQFDLLFRYGVTSDLIWGTTSSPLIVDGSLIVNPGAADASLVALDPLSGEERWRSPGGPAAFASFQLMELGGRRQLVGYDKTTLGGWDPATGERLWTLKPPREHDFNVPTPLAADADHLLVTTENNGTRLYAFDEEGRIVPEPVAKNRLLAPDTSSLLVLGRRVFGVWDGLFCLDLDRGLEPVWISEDPAYAQYASLLGAGDRVLVQTLDGELLLVDAEADEYRELSRHRVFEGDTGVYATPALLGTRLYVRGSTELVCLELGPVGRESEGD